MRRPQRDPPNPAIVIARPFTGSPANDRQNLHTSAAGYFIEIYSTRSNVGDQTRPWHPIDYAIACTSNPKNALRFGTRVPFH